MPRVPPANLDPETAALVRQQDADHGVNMFSAATPEDDAAVERLMMDGFQYHEALLHLFSIRHPPRPPQFPPQQQQLQGGYYPNQPYVSQPYPGQPYQGVQPGQPYPGQYPMQAQSFYQPNNSYYQQQPQPVMAQSFYQPPPTDVYPSQYPAPAQASASLTRKPSGVSQPPVLNGNQTSLLQQQRKQDASKAQQAHSLEKKPSGITRKGSFLGGLTRKSASNEDDLMARAAHMSDEAGQPGDHAKDKAKVPKLKYHEADVQKIVKMGFTRDQAVQALVENHHNVDEAVHMLTSM